MRRNRYRTVEDHGDGGGGGGLSLASPKLAELIAEARRSR